MTNLPESFRTETACKLLATYMLTIVFPLLSFGFNYERRISKFYTICV